MTFAGWKALKQVVEETATAARKKHDDCRAAVEKLTPPRRLSKSKVELRSCAIPLRRTIWKPRSPRDILEKAANELWAAMLLKGCVVNRVDFATEFLMFQKKATV
jgi:hypothetical protein